MTSGEQTNTFQGQSFLVASNTRIVQATATQVLVHSLARFTQRDIIVLVLSSVSDEVRDQLKHVGATRILEIDPVNYPWESKDAHRKGYNKACRYSKLLLWNLTEYDKVGCIVCLPYVPLALVAALTFIPRSSFWTQILWSCRLVVWNKTS